MSRIFPLVAMAGVLFCSLGLTAVAVEAQDAATDQEIESTPTEVTDLPTEATELDAEPTESGEETIDLSLSEEWGPSKGKPTWSKSKNPSEFTSDWGPGDSQPPWATGHGHTCVSQSAYRMHVASDPVAGWTMTMTAISTCSSRPLPIRGSTPAGTFWSNPISSIITRGMELLPG